MAPKTNVVTLHQQSLNRLVAASHGCPCLSHIVPLFQRSICRPSSSVSENYSGGTGGTGEWAMLCCGEQFERSGLLYLCTIENKRPPKQQGSHNRGIEPLGRELYVRTYRARDTAAAIKHSACICPAIDVALSLHFRLTRRIRFAPCSRARRTPFRHLRCLSPPPHNIQSRLHTIFARSDTRNRS